LAEIDIEMNAVGEKIRAHWQASGMVLPSGNTEAGIKDFESRYNVRLPQDFRDYFLRVNGMETHWPNAQDKEGFTFWPLERANTVLEEAANHLHSDEWSSFSGAESLFIFADYLDWSWAYAIKLSSDTLSGNPVFIIGKKKTPIEVAGSFSEFVNLYLIDSPILYGA
jgi:hypothetical protein